MSRESQKRAHCTDGHLLHWGSLFNILLFISILKIPISIIRLKLTENVKKIPKAYQHS